jgi:transcription elongation factor Elf1
MTETRLKFNCPSCGHKLAGVEAMNFATQVVRRTCPECKDRWQLVVKAIKVDDGVRMDKADLSFVDNAYTRMLAKARIAKVLERSL